MNLIISISIDFDHLQRYLRCLPHNTVALLENAERIDGFVYFPDDILILTNRMTLSRFWRLSGFVAKSMVSCRVISTDNDLLANGGFSCLTAEALFARTGRIYFGESGTV